MGVTSMDQKEENSVLEWKGEQSPVLARYSEDLLPSALKGSFSICYNGNVIRMNQVALPKHLMHTVVLRFAPPPPVFLSYRMSRNYGSFRVSFSSNFKTPASFEQSESSSMSK